MFGTENRAKSAKVFNFVGCSGRTKTDKHVQNAERKETTTREKKEKKRKNAELRLSVRREK
tara:strand:- start:845 stop:1027 length:183 start_codon:yes stop_codon:yes gene_type:complete